MLEMLNNKVGEWLRGGPDDDVVLSSRVRLARNIAGYPFLSRATDQEIGRVEEILHDKITNVDLGCDLIYHRLDTMDAMVRELLVERHLIGRDHADADWVRSVALCPDEKMSLMINEEDHLRTQTLNGGFRLQEAAERIIKADELLAEHIPFSFSAQYGYLTVCPTNVGTGIRVSAMVHLPGLVMAREMEKVVQLAQDMRLDLRGLYGEGTHASANLYQVSNQVSLGLSENEIVQQVKSAVEELIGLEREARKNFLSQHRLELSERIQKALDLLKTVKMISSEEALNFLSQIRMGAELGLVDSVSPNQVNELLLLTLPAHLQTMAGRRPDRTERNELRATYLKKQLMN